jgi:hypothetical protein
MKILEDDYSKYEFLIEFYHFMGIKIDHPV